MKKIAVLMTGIILIQNISWAFVVREADIYGEKTIPFSFISDTEELEEEIKIAGLDNVKIEKVYTNNGEVDAYIDGKYICLDFSGGERSNSIQTVQKTGVLEIEEALTDEDNRLIIYDADEKISGITEVSGDFESAEVNSNGKIEIKVNKKAVGSNGYDKSQTEKSEIKVSVDNTNKDRKCESKYIELEHEAIGKIKAKSGDASKVEDILTEDNCVKVLFDNGVPKLNENTVNSGYTYCWIDRSETGKFKPYNPNSVYNTDRNKITGTGDYLDKNQEDELATYITDKRWTDYCGAEINGVRYVYLFDKNNGIPQNSGEILEKDSITVSKQECNTEKYKVEFSKGGISYIPEGKLYSMGELVNGTSGWGETFPNWDWESKDSFYNTLTGKLETYVKHYKFFYGPKTKKAFGGYFTYPYSVNLEYEHYKPVKLYSGDVVYTYESKENVKGYLYNGSVKISYTQRKTVNDYPPTSPYNIKYDLLTNKISWEHGTDDYTGKENLYYEIQVYTDSWGNIITSNKGENSINKVITASDFDIRVRTADEIGQVSEWGYLSDNLIELSGKVSPYVINSGSKVNITAQTKSLSKIAKVEARCDELGINCQLEKTSEEVPKYFEMSYDLSADFLEEDEYIYTENSRYVQTLTGKYRNYSYNPKARTNKRTIEFKLPKDLEFTENGTFIFSNGNYLKSPLKSFVYNGTRYHLYMFNEIGIENKVTGVKDIFVAFENSVQKEVIRYNNIYKFVPQIIINTFEYSESGSPQYKTIEVPEEIADKPVIIAWNTDADRVTTIDVYLENNLIYSYSVPRENIDNYVKYINYSKTEKLLKKYVMSSSGYTPPNKKVTVNWAKIGLSVAYRYNIQDFPWLGYRVNENEYVREAYILNYNNNPEVRNTYRMLFLDEYASLGAMKKYISLLKNTNFAIKRDDGETTFGDDVLDYNCEFEVKDAVTDKNCPEGKYEVELSATDIDGKSCKIMLTVIVKNDEEQVYPGDEGSEEKGEIRNINVGRFFYKDGKGYLEELNKDLKNDGTEGFICAGETLGISIFAKDTEFIEADFTGDNSIKELDALTRRFLIDMPKKNGKEVDEVEENYKDFPKTIYPVSTDEEGVSEFRYFYTIPYRTKQTLESWYTLKTSSLEGIDKSKLFDRITDPYKVNIYINGEEAEYELYFDVFERWDTVLNRNIGNYIKNADSKWEMRTDK